MSLLDDRRARSGLLADEYGLAHAGLLGQPNRRDVAAMQSRHNIVPDLMNWARQNPVEAGATAVSMSPFEPFATAADVGLSAKDVYDAVQKDDWRGAAISGGLGLASAALPFVGYGAIRAYHGSPHDFDKFSMDRIGTGEGAQAYGHGLYFADERKVAEEYRQRLADVSAAEFDKIGIPPKDWNAATMFARAADPTQAEAAARDFANWTGREVTPELIEAYRSTLARRGHLYEVDIDADPEDFLDWDMPLSEQPEKVRGAFLNSDEMAEAKNIQARLDNDLLAQLGVSDGGSALSVEKRKELESALRAFTFTAETRGERAYQNMVGQANRGGAIGEHLGPNSPPIKTGPRAASDALRARGVKGIRYKDASSRGKDGGTYNYVVFDDKLIDIKNRE